MNGYYQEFGQESKGSSAHGEHSSSRGHNSMSSWDDWNEKERKESSGRGRTKSSDTWAGWDDVKDDGFDNYTHGSSNAGNNKSENPILRRRKVASSSMINTTMRKEPIKEGTGTTPSWKVRFFLFWITQSSSQGSSKGIKKSHSSWKISANGPRSNPQGSYNYGMVNMTSTIRLTNSAPVINGKQRYVVNGVSFIAPDTPPKVADYYNIQGVFLLGSMPDNPSPGGGYMYYVMVF